jgi:hypothetical protein
MDREMDKGKKKEVMDPIIVENIEEIMCAEGRTPI